MRGVPPRLLSHSPGDRRTRREGDRLVLLLAAAPEVRRGPQAAGHRVS
jgi:hypothetical protein